MANNRKNVSINYSSKDFESIRRDLLNHVERFYPDKFLDFSENSLGAMMVDAVSYVGDQLSFYIDYNVNESFMDSAIQPSNIARQAAILGYRQPAQQSTYGVVSLFVLVPATSVGLGPDRNYIPVLKRGTRFNSSNGQQFVLVENIDFANPSNLMVAGNVDANGTPTQYAIRAFGRVVSGFFKQGVLNVGDFERFKRVDIRDSNIAEIISVRDEDGNEYFEVENLSQDVIFKEVVNSNFKSDNVPSIMKPTIVSRKFVVEYGNNTTTLQFGSGDVEVDTSIADPSELSLDIIGKNYITDTSFDPTRIAKNSSMGIVPTNTRLFVTYRVNNPNNSNTSAGSINSVANPLVSFEDVTTLANNKVQDVIRSIEVQNDEPILGAITSISGDELKRRALDSFGTQNRAVTQRDYENLVYRMPSKFGSVRRCSVQKDPDSQKRNLNLYVVSVDPNGFLVETNSTIKSNLKTWINHYRMINDTVDILDAFIVNFGIEYVIKTLNTVEKFDVLNRCNDALTRYFADKQFIGEPLSVGGLFNTLGAVRGVQDVVKARYVLKSGVNYSNFSFVFQENYSPDGDYLMVPKNVIMELKFPETDIKGKLR